MLYRDIDTRQMQAYDNDRQGIYMRSLLSKLCKEPGNFPLIFARLHSKQFGTN